MFEDLIKPKNKKKSTKINLITKHNTPVELLMEVNDIIWDLAKEPCYHCGRDTGEHHKEDCKFYIAMSELDNILSGYRHRK